MNLRPFTRVLVANRGEIAVRVIRACREAGLGVVAIYSDADVDALHVQLADAAFRVGEAPSAASYLRADAVIEVAKAAGCDAVHPGYGFLSENADFAQAVLDADLVWIGPPPSAIRSMGSKTGARQTMIAAGVPVVPGTSEASADVVELGRVAADIGYPVMLKASAGGGGKGMRRVDTPDALEAAFAATRSEAAKSFGDDAVYLEKCIVEPRHVEIQVLADGHGNVVHLFDRDCSIQRRNQKVFEEAPCPVLPQATRLAMAATACQAARSVNYVGAGTCEFLLAADGSYYFLEMNTRLQVEHPITECITGVDLVLAQLRVAAGEPLWFEQADLHIHGHAVECRIYAEDVSEGFMPAPGPLLRYREPSGPWVRVDSGVREGDEVAIYYDPMVSKLVVWGRTREQALARCRAALRVYRVVGIPTSIPFFLALFDDPDFKRGVYSTGFISPEWLERFAEDGAVDEGAVVAAAIARFEDERTRKNGGPSVVEASPWRRSHSWSAMNRGVR